jgi:hypothetical protein
MTHRVGSLRFEDVKDRLRKVGVTILWSDKGSGLYDSGDYRVAPDGQKWGLNQDEVEERTCWIQDLHEALVIGLAIARRIESGKPFWGSDLLEEEERRKEGL